MHGRLAYGCGEREGRSCVEFHSMATTTAIRPTGVAGPRSITGVATGEAPPIAIHNMISYMFRLLCLLWFGAVAFGGGR